MTTIEHETYESILSEGVLEFYEDYVNILRLKPNFDNVSIDIESNVNGEFHSFTSLGGNSLKSNVLYINHIEPHSSGDGNIYIDGFFLEKTHINNKPINAFVTKYELHDYANIKLSELISDNDIVATKEWANTTFLSKDFLGENNANIQWVTENYYTQGYIDTNIANVQWVEDNYYTQEYIKANIANVQWVEENYYTQGFLNFNFANTLWVEENYYTQDYIDANIANVQWVEDNYYTRGSIELNYSTAQEIIDQFYTKDYIDNNYTLTSNIDTLLSRVSERIANIEDYGSVELIGFATEQFVFEKIYDAKSDLLQTFSLINNGFSSTGNITTQYLEDNNYTKESRVQELIDASGGGGTGGGSTGGGVDMTQMIEYLQDFNYTTESRVQELIDDIIFPEFSVDMDGYLTTSEAEEIYLKKSDFTTDSGLSLDGYLTVDEASSTYLRIVDASGATNLDGFLTIDEAQSVYLKKDDLFETDDPYTRHVEYNVSANINVHKMGFNNFLQVDASTKDDDYISYFFDNPPNEYIYFQFSNLTLHLGGLLLQDTFLMKTPMYKYGFMHEGTNQIYNGVYIVSGITSSDPTNPTNLILRCLRSPDLNQTNHFEGALITVKNGSSYLISSPVENIDSDPVIINSLIKHDFGTLAIQNHDNVNITGGDIQCPVIHVNELRPVDGSNVVSVVLNDNSEDDSFKIKATSDLDDNVVFEVDGLGCVSAFQFNSLSDRSLKTNEETITNPLSLVRKLEGKTFDWIDQNRNKNPGHKQYGFIAQEVAAEFPTLVSETLNEYLTVDYSKVVSILVEAIKTIHDTIQNAGLDERFNTNQNNGTVYNNDNNIDYTPTSPKQPVINQKPVPGHVDTDIIAFGNINKNTIFVNSASTPRDTISMYEIFNSGNYVLYTNNGTNFIDGVLAVVGDVILIKDSTEKKHNGVFEINLVQDGAAGTFSQVVRHDKFKDLSNIDGSAIVVEPSGFAGRGKGLSNPGFSYICTYPTPLTHSPEQFVLDETEVHFISINQQEYGSIALQNHDNVNITGGSISIPTLKTQELKPLDSNEISVVLGSAEEEFNIKSETEPGFKLCVIDHSGKVSAKDFFSPSDQRLKTNISDIDNALSLVRKLHGVTFDWKDNMQNNPNYKQYGFIAQEVQLHFPTLVHTRSDGKLSVDYSKVVSILVEAVKNIGDMLNM